MSNFREFFGLEDSPRQYYAEGISTKSPLASGGFALSKFRLPKLFGEKKEAILNESLILRTAKRGLSLTLRMKKMKVALMTNDLEVLFLCDVWPELNHEFEKAGFRVGSSDQHSGTYDVIVTDVRNHSLSDVYPLVKPTGVLVLLGPLDVLPSDPITLIDELEELRGAIFKASSRLDLIDEEQ